jgi:hypothetical protein
MMKRLTFASFTASLLIASPALADVISLRVDGGLSAAELAPRLASELGTTVAASSACPAPCLDVLIADGNATVRFTPATGAPRVRTIELGGDRAAWPTLVTLLAGNLARDEASQLLDALPQPARLEAAPAAAPATEPEPVGSPAQVDAPTTMIAAPPAPTFAASTERAKDGVDERVFVFGLVPGLSTDLTSIGARHDLALHLAIGMGGGLDGFSIAGAADIERGPVDGFQLSGALNVATALDGFQLAGAANVAGVTNGMQVAGAVNVAGDTNGTQIAGGVNVAADTNGTQIAGGVNVARDVDGLQIAPINIARTVQGTQIGVINIGGRGDGASIGLVNIVPGGRTDVEASVDTHAIGAVLLRHGGRHWHNVYGVGGQRAQDAASGTRDDLWMAGLGLGPTWRAGATTFDLEAMAWHVSSGAHYDTGLSLLNQLRLSVAFDVGPVALVAGGAVNVYVGDQQRATYLAFAPGATTTPPMETGVGVHVWPTLFVGARL